MPAAWVTPGPAEGLGASVWAILTALQEHVDLNEHGQRRASPRRAADRVLAAPGSLLSVDSGAAAYQLTDAAQAACGEPSRST